MKGKKPHKNKKSKFLIIGSKRPKKSTIKALIKAAEKLFDVVLFVPVHKVRIVYDRGRAMLYYKDINLMEFDACYPRFGAKYSLMGEPILKLLDDSPCYSPVTLRSYHYANHKYFTIKKLAEADLPVVLSSLSISPNAMQEQMAHFGYPVVLKLISGFAGKGVVLVENEKQLRSILDTIHLFEDYISAQKFVGRKNTDIRCYVIGEQVIAAKRTGHPGDWRANMSRGGTVERIKPNKKMIEVAVKAAKVLKFDICSVDVIETSELEEGFTIIEVNFQPGPFYEYLKDTVPNAWVEYIYLRTTRNTSTGK
jgi:ribosomal protein S6--L-glutamate ligase